MKQEQHIHHTEKPQYLQAQFNRWADAVLDVMASSPPSPLQAVYLTTLQQDRRENILHQAVLLHLGAPLPNTLETTIAQHAARILWFKEGSL
ncbi:MAG: hypothetical protein M1318_08430 [Firmicutes bacterium]|jgi:hypothetical protein|nr:hypothetical protein [Bacillota bacterium]